jgi:hypothetical protein
MTIIGETANVASNVGNLFRVRQQSSCGGHPPWVAQPPIRLTSLALGFDSTDFFSQLPCVRVHRGLTFDKKGKLYMVNELNHMWVRDVFAEPFLTLVKNIGKEETQSDVLVIHRKWIPVLVGESSNREVTRDLVADVQVQ